MHPATLSVNTSPALLRLRRVPNRVSSISRQVVAMGSSSEDKARSAAESAKDTAHQVRARRRARWAPGGAPRIFPEGASRADPGVQSAHRSR